MAEGMFSIFLVVIANSVAKILPLDHLHRQSPPALSSPTYYLVSKLVLQMLGFCCRNTQLLALFCVLVPIALMTDHNFRWVKWQPRMA